jgi:hypothetical protein
MAASEIHTDPERIKEVISCLPVFVAELRTGFGDIMDAFKHLGDTWRDEEYDHFKKCLEPLHQTIDEMTQELVRQHAHLQSDMENLLILRQITQGEAGLPSQSAGAEKQPGMEATMMEPQSREPDRGSKDTAPLASQQSGKAQQSAIGAAAVHQAPPKKSSQAQPSNDNPSCATLNQEESDVAKMPVRVPVPPDKVAAAQADDFEFRQLTGKHLLILAKSGQLAASIALAALRGALAQCVPDATRIVIANFLLPELTLAEFASMLPKTFSDRVTVLNNWHDLVNQMQELEREAAPSWPTHASSQVTLLVVLGMQKMDIPVGADDVPTCNHIENEPEEIVARLLLAGAGLNTHVIATADTLSNASRYLGHHLRSQHGLLVGTSPSEPSSNRLPDFWATASWHKPTGSTLHVELLSPSVGEMIPFGPCGSGLIQKVLEFLCEQYGTPPANH